jgi:hypothetical protein
MDPFISWKRPPPIARPTPELFRSALKPCPNGPAHQASARSRKASCSFTLHVFSVPKNFDSKKKLPKYI